MTSAMGLFMTLAWSIMMTRIVEHFDDKGMEHCDDRAQEYFNEKGREHCDDKISGALW